MQQLRCAPLLILFGFLLSSASCGDEQAAPTSGAAGLVIAVQGEVSAMRGDEAARPLAVDDVIYVKDTVKTGEGASLSIGFRHNNATWNVGASKEQAVVDSIGWRAKRQSESPFADDQKGSEGAAGRHTGQQAAETGSTLMADQDEPEVPQLSAENLPVQGAQPEPMVAAPPPPPQQQPETKPEKPRRRKKPGPKPKPGDPLNFVPTPPTPDNVPAEPEPKKKAGLLLTLAWQCQAENKGSGTLHYSLEVADGKLVSFTAKDPGILSGVVTCMRARLKSRDLSKLKSKTGSILLN